MLIILVSLLLFWRGIFYKPVADDNNIKYPRFEHCLNLFFHIATSMLIAYRFNFWAGILFAVHPIAIQSGAVYLSGRGYLLAGLLTMAMVSVSWGWVYYCFAAFAAVPAILAPLMLNPAYWVLAIPMGWYKYKLNVKPLLDDNTRTSSKMKRLAWNKLIVAVKTYGYYARMCLFPMRLGLHHSFLKGLDLTEEYDRKCYAIDKDFWMGVGIIGLLLFIPAKFGVWWFSIFILPYCHFITTQQNISERYAYVANIGMMVMLSALPQPILIALASAYFVRTWFAVPSYSHDFWIKQYNLLEHKDLSYMWNVIGSFYAKRGDVGSAMDHFHEGLKYAAHDYKLNFNIGNMYMVLNQKKDARKYLEVARDNMPRELPQGDKYINDALTALNDIENGKELVKSLIRVVE